jgi:hypothetical protein
MPDTIKTNFENEDQILNGLTFIDAPLRSLALSENKELLQFLLSVFLEREELNILQTSADTLVEVIAPMRDLPSGKSICFDVLGKDEQKNYYAIIFYDAKTEELEDEILLGRSKLGLHLIMTELDFDSFSKLNYIVFTPWDEYGQDIPFYKSMICYQTRKGEVKKDGLNSIVNLAYHQDDALGQLIFDLQCADPDQMHHPILAKAMRYYKEDPKGRNKLAQAYKYSLLQMH